MSSSSDNVLFRSPQLLEENEDIIAACLENLQLGRLDECIKHYSLLQNNLIALAVEIDNYPLGDDDPLEALQAFPDEIMRKVMKSIFIRFLRNDVFVFLLTRMFLTTSVLHLNLTTCEFHCNHLVQSVWLRALALKSVAWNSGTQIQVPNYQFMKFRSSCQ